MDKHHARIETCSDSAAEVSPAGTAPYAHRWWLIEDPGPWTSHAVADHTSPHIAAIRERSHASDYILLVRPFAPHRKPAHEARVWRFTAGTQIVEVAALLSFSQDIPAETVNWQATDDYPMSLVCTNGKRDACCAVKGRELLKHLPDLSRIWESTHLGGHRFAPSVLFIPSGYVCGRITPTDMALMHAPSPRLPIDRLRGRSDLTGAEQVADITVRQYAQWDDALITTDVVKVDSPEVPDNSFVVTNGTPQAFLVTLTQLSSVPYRASCAAEPKTAEFWSPVASPTLVDDVVANH